MPAPHQYFLTAPAGEEVPLLLRESLIYIIDVVQFKRDLFCLTVGGTAHSGGAASLQEPVAAGHIASGQ